MNRYGNARERMLYWIDMLEYDAYDAPNFADFDSWEQAIAAIEREAVKASEHEAVDTYFNRLLARWGAEPEHAPERIIGYTAMECERDMRRLTDGKRGCANPDEHAS